MATFPSITPTYGTTQTVEQKGLVTKLGDGYEFRTVFGLPANKRLHVVNLTFNISETASCIEFNSLPSHINPVLL